MTLIECFTRSHVDNISACLRLQPDRMAMIGNAAEMSESVKRYEKLLKQRGISTEITLYDVQSMDHIPETRSEIDVILMHGTTPLFISCKNGNIGEEELYKLHTVAERFGGPYVRKMLIATNLDRKNPTANRAFIQRARDMGIFLVTDADELSETEWADIFQNAMR